MLYQITKSVVVNGVLNNIYTLCGNFEKFPKWLKSIKPVSITGDRSSHWSIQDSSTGRISEWDIEITQMEKNKQIAWEGTNGENKARGKIILKTLSEDGVRVTVSLQYLPETVATGESNIQIYNKIEKQLLNNLDSLKVYAEGHH